MSDNLGEGECSQDNCIICLDKNNEALFRCFRCKTLYHKHCIVRWLERSQQCTVCREPLDADDILSGEDVIGTIGGGDYIAFDINAKNNIINYEMPDNSPILLYPKIVDSIYTTLNLIQLGLLCFVTIKVKYI